MRPIFKQIAELIGGAIQDLRKSIEPRLKALEEVNSAKAIEDLKHEVGNGVQAVLQIELDTKELVKTLEQVKLDIVREVEEAQARAQSQLEAQIKSFHEAALAREKPQNELVGQLQAKLAELSALPPLNLIVMHCVEALRSTIQIPDVKEFLNSEQVNQLILNATRDLQPLLDLTSLSKEVAGLLPTEEAVAKRAAALVPVAQTIDVSGFVKQETLEQLQVELEKKYQPKIELSSLVGSVVDMLPSVEQVAERAAALVPVVDIKGFLTQEQIQELIVTDRQKFAVAPVDPQEIARTAVQFLPAFPDPQELAEAAAALVPKPKDGQSVTLEQVAELVAKAFEEVTIPAGPTALEVAEIIEAGHISKWALDFERRAQDLLQRAVDRIPIPKDGVDGMGFEDQSIEYDGNRTFTFVLAKDARRKTFEFKVPVMIYRGIFSESAIYDKGDVATWGGSSWVALKDLPQGKPGMSHDWQLIVKKGRDGSSK